MIKFVLKLTILTLLICCTTWVVKAQIGYDYSVYDIGVATDFNQVSGEVLPKTTKQSVNFNLTFNQTPYTNFVFEAQLGRFAGGDSLKSPGTQFTSSFSAYILRGQLQLGEFIDYSDSHFNNAIKNLYLSAGLGYLVNHITGKSNTYILTPGLTTSTYNRSHQPFIPIRIGYEFKLFNTYQQPSFKVDLGYQYNYVFSDNVDGYTYGKNKDAYTQFSIGVKFAIGGSIISYKKQIQY